MHKKKISLFSVEFCLNADKIRRGTILCFKNFLVWQKFRDMRRLSRFSVKNFLSHIVGKIRRGDLCFKQISGIEKFHIEEGGWQG